MSQITTSNPLLPNPPPKNLLHSLKIFLPFPLLYSVSPCLKCPFLLSSTTSSRAPSNLPLTHLIPASHSPIATPHSAFFIRSVPETLSHSSCLNSTHRLMVPNLFLQTTCLLCTVTQICNFLMDFTWIIRRHFQLTVTNVDSLLNPKPI